MAAIALGRLATGNASRRLILTPWQAWIESLNGRWGVKSHVNLIAPVFSKLQDILQPAFNLFNSTGFLLAVPKKRVSHRRKRIRNHNKFPRNRKDIEICVVCGNEKLEGHLCGHCYERIKEETEQILAERPKTDLPVGLKTVL
eukprot:gene3241-3723_t